MSSIPAALAHARPTPTAPPGPAGRTVALDEDRLARFAATAQALGVSLSAARALLAIFLGDDAPSVAGLGRRAQEAGRRAGALLAVLDQYSRPKARQVAADEIFSGRRPVLMTVEQDSLCWLGGRLAPDRGGPQWAQEFGQLPAAEQVTRDGGLGLRKGLELANAARAREGRPAIADQEDHFHILHRGRRALREVRRKAIRAYHKADKAERALRAARRRGRIGGGRVSAVHRWWEQAEAAWDRWAAQERAFERLRAALSPWAPGGELNTRARAEAEVRAALAELTGPEWSRLRAKLAGRQAFTFLDRAHGQLAALPVAAGLREAAVQAEGLRRCPAALRGEGGRAAALRGVLLAAGLVLWLAGESGARAVALVRGVVGGAWRSSSLVEGVNSVLRMQQARQRRLTQGLLDLKRLYWNARAFRAGRRKGQSPYGRLGLVLPGGSWWELLKMTPEQLGERLSRLNPAA
jgi:hypothetical protein